MEDLAASVSPVIRKERCQASNERSPMIAKLQLFEPETVLGIQREENWVASSLFFEESNLECWEKKESKSDGELRWKHWFCIRGNISAGPHAPSTPGPLIRHKVYYRCWFCVGKALWRWFYLRSRKRDHFQTLATGVPKLKTWLGTQRVKEKKRKMVCRVQSTVKRERKWSKFCWQFAMWGAWMRCVRVFVDEKNV